MNQLFSKKWIWVLLSLLIFGGLITRPIKGGLSNLAQLAVHHDGRVKPFEAWAQSWLRQFSGKSTIKFEGKTYSAREWMAGVLFDPESRFEFPIFQINDPGVALELGIEGEETRFHSWNALKGVEFKLQTLAEEASKLERKSRSREENEFVRIWSNYSAYKMLNESLSFFKKDVAFTIKSPELRAELKFSPKSNNSDGPEFSFFDIYQKAAFLGPRLISLQTKPDSLYTPVDTEAFELSKELMNWSNFYQERPFYLYHFNNHDKEFWLSHWTLLSSQLMGTMKAHDDFLILKSAKDLWTQGKYDLFDLEIAKLSESLKARNGEFYRLEGLSAEFQYLKWDPFYISQILFGLALILSLVSLIAWRGPLGSLSGSILWATLLFQTLGLVARMYIQIRPPVTNLYETFIFTAWACVILGLAVRHLRNIELGNLVAAFGGLSMLLLSNKYAAEGDTMKVLVAVLDSNFWLSTHVVTITLGYAGVIAAGIVAHLYLIQSLSSKIKQPEFKAKREDSYKSMMGILAFGLTFSFIGTVLGGIWADQSWGRFWGWDPKENGALLIVLWCGIVYHAKMAGMVHRIGAAALTAWGIIVVMLAWFGINLLGVGLHSYGFTEGAAFWLLFYCGFQTLVVVALVLWAKKKGLRI